MPLSRRLSLALTAVLALASSAFGQITFTYNFDNSTGFYTTQRQDAIRAAGTYLRSQLDGRGSITIDLTAQDLGFSTGGYTLAFAGTSYSFTPGVASLTNGNGFRQGTTGSGPSSFGTFNNNVNVPWYSGVSASVPSNQVDLQSVALHETTHALGFLSFLNTNGTGGQNSASGSPDTFSRLDSFLRAGPNATDPRLIAANGGYNTAVPTSQINSGNNYFHGEFAVAANGGNAVRAAVGNGHINATGGPANAVMLPGIGNGQARREYTNIDLAILIDMGWNQFVWRNTTGNFADNVASLTNARWQNLDGANMFSPVGTITTNAVLRFGGAGGYTATNNLTLAATTATGGDANRHLLTRLILNATAGTSTIAASGGNVFRFDSTIGVTPQIRQDGAGAFNISHPLELTGRNLELTGNGAGSVTLSGPIGQQTGQIGSVVKSGTSTFVLNGTNTYTGTTVVSGGTLYVNGNSAGATGAVTVNSGGTLSGTGTVGGATTVNGGGAIEAGSIATPVGTLTIDDSLTVAGGGTLRAQIGSGGAADLLNMNGSSGYTLTLANGARVVLDGGSFASGSYRLVDLNATAQLLAGSTAVGNDTTITTFTSTGGVGGTNVNGVGDVDLFLTGFNLSSGDRLLLRRDSFGDLVLVFTPVPEPGGVLAVCGLVAAGGLAWRRWKKGA
jgi:autotransporter-associated beta strand protein